MIFSVRNYKIIMQKVLFSREKYIIRRKTKFIKQFTSPIDEVIALRNILFLVFQHLFQKNVFSLSNSSIRSYRAVFSLDNSVKRSTRSEFRGYI